MGTEIRARLPAGESAGPLPGTPASARSLLLRAKEESVASGELVRLILAGTRRVDSWLIENRILPVLLERGERLLRFTLEPRNGQERKAAILPLADGEAFACSTSGRWLVLERHEAVSAIQYVGFRYAVENHWVHGFTAVLQRPGQEPRPLQPFEVARLWQEVTGSRPRGFEQGVIDEMEALGLQLIGRVFNTQGRLGL